MFTISLKENTAFVNSDILDSDILASILFVKVQMMLVLIKCTTA